MSQLEIAQNLAYENVHTRAMADLDAFYAEHVAFVRRAVVRFAGRGLDADDLVQDVFVQAFRALPTFKGNSSTQTWLYGVALRVVANARRRARLRRFFGLDEVAHPAIDETPARQYERAEAKAIVYAILDRLSEKKRTVLILFELEGLSGEEIAEIVGCPPKTVWTRLFHARKEFLRHLERTERRERELRSSPSTTRDP